MAFHGTANALAPQCADIVVANIQLLVLQQILPELERVRKPGGALILSGILEDQNIPGIRPITRRTRDGWACITC